MSTAEPEFVLDGAGWDTADDVYDAFFAAVGAPSWHGRNLAALNDSIGTGNVNKVDPPYRLRIRGMSAMGSSAREMVDEFARLVNELRRGGVPVTIECEQ